MAKKLRITFSSISFLLHTGLQKDPGGWAATVNEYTSQVSNGFSICQKKLRISHCFYKQSLLVHLQLINFHKSKSFSLGYYTYVCLRPDHLT